MKILKTTAIVAIGAGTMFGAMSAQAERLYAKCTGNNSGVSVQVNTDKGEGALYLMGNHVAKLKVKYLPIAGSDPQNIIEMKGDGFRAFHLNKSRKIIYFREGSTGTFCNVSIERR